MSVILRGPQRKRRIKVTPLRILILTMLIAGLVGGGTYWGLKRWAPPRERYPIQGITVSAKTGTIYWSAVQSGGVDFAYLLASSGAAERDPAFAANLEGVRAEGIQHGAVHRYSLCASATVQATAFIATVPRDPAMLPPVLAIDFTPDCPARPSRDRLLAELNIALNQIEAHGGKPAVLRVSQPVEQAYDLASGINRTLWVEGEFFAPVYTTRPWVMWAASTWRRVPGIDGPVEWDVVRP